MIFIIGIGLGICYQTYIFLGLFTYTKFEEKYLNTLNSMKVDLNKMDGLHRKIKYMSGLHQYLGHLNVYNFVMVSMAGMGLVAYVFYRLTHLFLASGLVGGVIFFTPYLMLGSWCEKRNKALSSEMVTFISLMSRWSVIRDDVYYCIEKSTEKAQAPLKTYMETFLIQVKYSGMTEQAFQELLYYSDNALYRNFIINMRQASYSKGDLCQLLERLEEEAYHIEGEHSRLMSETYFDRLIIGLTAVVAVLMSVFMLVFNPLMRDFYFNHLGGQILLTLYICLFLLALYVTGKITDFNY